MLILLVEDDVSVADSTIRFLDMYGATVHLAPTRSFASEALRADVSDGYDLLIVDYDLPDGKGTEVIDRYAGRARVVLVSGDPPTEEQLAAECPRRRPDEVLTKGLGSIDRLAEIVKELS